jgi:eukaryotic-like serine/threonine-protein kinase
MSGRFDSHLEMIIEQALELDAAEQGAFLDSVCAGDASMRGELDRLLRSGFDDDGQDLKDLFSGVRGEIRRRVEIPSGTRLVDRFTVVKKIGSGGMADVYLVREDDFDRHLALKVIREGLHGSEYNRNRFLNEAKLLGLLQNQNIVPVHRMGELDDRRPYYAMRFVHGDSLMQAINRFYDPATAPHDPRDRVLGLHSLLRRFVDVCNAAAYSHSRGVVHRDIKPANIILGDDGEYGETFLVDWGLAKPTSPGAFGPDVNDTLPLSTIPKVAATQPGAVSGTPEYMSPEQAAGDHARVGPSSDVYSLGATLYTLLTGRVPFNDVSVTGILRKVQAGKFPPPATAREGVPRPLEAVCLKAMALAPESRYPSAQALSNDIEAWMADEPVSAWREPLSTRGRRWVKRHRPAVSAAIAVLIVFGAALAAALLRERTNVERLGRAKAQSDRRLDQTLEAVEQYYKGVSEDVLLREPGFKELRARLLEKPRQFYEQLTRDLESEHDDRASSMLAKGCRDLGKIMSLLGRYPEAKRQAEAAIRLYSQLITMNPGTPGYQNGLASSYDDLGDVQRNMGDRKEATESLRKAIAVRGTLVAAHPDVADYKNGVALSHSKLGILQRDAGDSKQAAQSHREAISIHSDLVRGHPHVLDYQDSLALNYSNLGIVLNDIGDSASAAESFRGAIANFSQIVAAQPDSRDYQDNLALSCSNLGNALCDMGNREGGAASFREAIAIYTRLVKAHPNIPDYQNHLATTYGNLGGVQSEMGEALNAEVSTRKAVKILAELLSAHPDVPEYLSVLGDALDSLGATLERQDRRGEAEQAYRQAIEKQRVALEKGPGVVESENCLSSHYAGLSRVLRAQGHADEAAEYTLQRRALWKNNAREIFKAACDLALCVPISTDRARQQVIAGEAVATLRSAIAAGWDDAVLLSRNQDLAAVRDREDFRRLVVEMLDRAFPADPFAP